MSGILYIVATPIGNLEEISPRALRILSEVDVIAAEDTRTTRFLLMLEGIKVKKIVSYHKFNDKAKIDSLLKKLLEGQNVALVSEAGTPCISDPGYLLVKEAAAADIAVVGVSGSCSLITAVSVSGFPAEPFMFVGFLPRKTTDIIRTITTACTAAPQNLTLVFFESPKRITAAIELLAEHFPQASLCCCNDLTKKFERIYRGSPMEVLEALKDNENAEKGEYTCVLYMQQSFFEEIKKDDSFSLESQLLDIMVKTCCSIKEAVNALSEKLDNTTKKEIYAASLRLKNRLK